MAPERSIALKFLNFLGANKRRKFKILKSLISGSYNLKRSIGLGHFEFKICLKMQGC